MTPPSTLTKYCPAKTALNVLQNRSLRWCAPYLFHDPFELQHDSDADFTAQTLLESLVKTVSTMIFALEPPRGSTKNPLLNAVNRWRDEERFSSEEEAINVLSELLSDMVDKHMVGIESLMASWRQLARNIRIASFCGHHDNLIGWQSFADNHRGIALRFHTGESTALVDPQKIRYQTRPAMISSRQEQIGVLLGRVPAPGPDSFLEKLSIKNKLNIAEDEWRCFDSSHKSLDEADQSNWYTDKKFDPSELSAVYFGININKSTRKEIYNLVKKQYKGTLLYQAGIQKGEFELSFEAIK